MDDQNKKVEVEKINVERKFDGSKLGSELIKYTAYVAIFFGLLYFVAKYIIPMFN